MIAPPSRQHLSPPGTVAGVPYSVQLEAVGDTPPYAWNKYQPKGMGHARGATSQISGLISGHSEAGWRLHNRGEVFGFELLPQDTGDPNADANDQPRELGGAPATAAPLRRACTRVTNGKGRSPRPRKGGILPTEAHPARRCVAETLPPKPSFCPHQGFLTKWLNFRWDPADGEGPGRIGVWHRGGGAGFEGGSRARSTPPTARTDDCSRIGSQGTAAGSATPPVEDAQPAAVLRRFGLHRRSLRGRPRFQLAGSPRCSSRPFHSPNSLT